MIMKTFILLTFALLLLVSPSIAQFKFMRDALGGTKDMVRAYTDMREANYKGADKYFHARGNFDAAQRGPGGVWASKVISNTREFIQGANKQDSIDDQKANNWGRNGGDPNKYRPKGLPDKY